MASDPVFETHLSLPLVSRGKVRDIYAVGEDRLLIVTTDRISAFDVVFDTPIPQKGRVLNQLSAFWFRHFESWMPHHLLEIDPSRMGLPANVLRRDGALLEGRSILVRRAKPFSVECVVRGYLAGSGWKDYQKTARVCGHVLPAGLTQCEKLPQPIFTPATKETTGHDINIDFEATVRRIGRDWAHQLRDLSIRIYEEGRAYADTQGILIADTKFEFGLLDDRIILIDEVLTPDSSRFWPKDRYQWGQDQPSYDKQIIRNYLLELGWNQQPPPPPLPPEIIRKTSLAYQDVYHRLVDS